MVWPIVWQLVTFIASLVVGELLRPKIRIENASPAGKGDFDLPTADESRRIPWVAGTVKLEAPNVVWWGDFLALPITRAAGKGGFMGMGRTIWQTIGYRYYIGMHLALCLGPVELLEIRADDKVVWNHAIQGVDPVNTQSGVWINAQGLFGGEDSGGGLFGVCHFLPGDQTHTIDPYLQQQLGSPLPAWRGVASLIWCGPSWPGAGYNPQTPGYVGTSTRIAPIAATVRRLYSNLGLTPAQTNLNGNANPAELIYYLATADEDDGGMAMPIEMIDLPSLIAGGQQLASEAFGVALTWDNADPVQKIIEEICKTIDGAWYLDFRTGKWTLALARGGYDVASLLSLDEDHVTIENWADTTLDETANEVVVTYRSRRLDPGDATTRVAGGYVISDKQVIAKDMAARHAQGALVSQSISYPLIGQGALAMRVAQRDLFALSTPLTKVDLVADRTAYRLKPGDCFRLSYAPKGVTDLVMRVQMVSPGSLQSGAVRITAIRDVFALGAAIYDEPAPSSWVNPVQGPAPCPAQQVLEAPYHLTRVDLGKLLLLAQRPNGSCRAYEIWERTVESSLSNHGMGLAFCPVGTLTTPLSPSPVDATLSVIGGGDLGILASALASDLRLGANLAFFETGEVIAFMVPTFNGDGTLTLTGVWRGLLDTVPAAHAAGERIWFGAYGQSTTDDQFPTGTIAKVKLLPVSSRGTLPLTSAPELSLTFTGRAVKPYPPGLPKINGLDVPITTVGDAVLTWRHRHRVTQTQITRQDDPSEVAPEGTYTLRQIVGFLPTDYAYQTAGFDQAFQIYGPNPGCPQLFDVSMLSASDVVHVYLLPAIGQLGRVLNNVPLPEGAVALWNVTLRAASNKIQPNVATDLRPIYASTTTAVTTTSATLTAAQRLALSTNGLLPVRLGIKTVNGALESQERLSTAFTMTGFGMCFGTYFGGIQQ